MNDRSTHAAHLEKILQALHDRLKLVAAIGSTGGPAEAIEASRDLRRIRSWIGSVKRERRIEEDRNRPGTPGNPIPLRLPPTAMPDAHEADSREGFGGETPRRTLKPGR
jgi:hypothetical protein